MALAPKGAPDWDEALRLLNPPTARDYGSTAGSRQRRPWVLLSL